MIVFIQRSEPSRSSSPSSSQNRNEGKKRIETCISARLGSFFPIVRNSQARAAQRGVVFFGTPTLLFSCFGGKQA